MKYILAPDWTDVDLLMGWKDEHLLSRGFKCAKPMRGLALAPDLAGRRADELPGASPFGYGRALLRLSYVLVLDLVHNPMINPYEILCREFGFPVGAGRCSPDRERAVFGESSAPLARPWQSVAWLFGPPQALRCTSALAPA
ncbi:hypothetical protein PG985_015021 [Apiospora marii]|uniref:Uncharacterized protein n=1 Tax=Apiospora marii TaxID=335849 RepID=A0ABR1RJD9_9PEZI